MRHLKRMSEMGLIRREARVRPADSVFDTSKQKRRPWNYDYSLNIE